MEVKFDGRIITWHQKKAKTIRKPEGLINDGVSNFSKKVSRRRTKLIKLLYSIEKEPYWFISLIYPHEKSKEEIAIKIKNDLNSLANRIRYNFPVSWFIYSIEWSKKSRLHIHLIGRKCSNTEHRLTFLIPQWWKQIVGSKNKFIADVKCIKKRSSIYLGYLTKKEKRKSTATVTKLLKNQYIFGVINRKNLPRSKTTIYKMTNSEFLFLKKMLIKDYEQSKKFLKISDFHLNQIKNSESGFHIIYNLKIFSGYLTKN